MLSAWCFGVLNSHHRFFISYTAPVAWNVAIISALIFFRQPRWTFQPLAAATAWGSVAGQRACSLACNCRQCCDCFITFARVLALASSHVRQVLRSFFPVFMSRGVVQISAFVDAFLASFLGQGAVVALNYAAESLHVPVSLFGMSVSAAELPAMSKTLGARRSSLRRCATGWTGTSENQLLHRAFGGCVSALGDVIAAVLYQTGKFTHRRFDLRLDDTRGLRRRLAGFDARPALLVDVLRSARHKDAVALCGDASGAGSALGYFCSIPCRACSASTHGWAQRESRPSGHRGLG